jgi:hydrogenase nickel incorporation protein HypB
VVQINTGSGCHLDAATLAAAVRRLDPGMHSLVMIENVVILSAPRCSILASARGWW